MTIPTTASELSSADFELFWDWLVETKKYKRKAKRAEMSKVVNVFNKLDLFESSDDKAEFIKSWGREKEKTVLAYELRVCLIGLSPSQFQKLYRFIVALQVKDREDKAKDHEKKLAHQKKARKILQWKKIKVARKQKCDDDRSLATHPYQHGESIEIADIMHNFKLKHKVKEKKKNPVLKFVSFVRNLSTSSPKASKLERKSSVSPAPSKSLSSSHSNEYDANFLDMIEELCNESSDTDSDITMSMRSLSSRASTGRFSQRPPTARSILQKKICSNEAMIRYRKMNNLPISEIDESLLSFNSSLDNSSIGNSICVSQSRRGEYGY